jgi:hypothetical protein
VNKNQPVRKAPVASSAKSADQQYSTVEGRSAVHGSNPSRREADSNTSSEEGQQGPVDESCGGGNAGVGGGESSGSIASAPVGGVWSHPPLRSHRLWTDHRDSETVANYIQDYCPKGYSDQTWARIGPFVSETIAAAAPQSVYRASVLLSVFTGYVAFCDQAGLPLERDVLLNHRLIERYVLVGLKRHSEGTRGNYRTELYSIARALVTDYPARLTPLSRSDPSEPYGEADVAALYALMAGQSTTEARHSGLVLVAGGFGAGLTRADYGQLRGTDVRREGADVVVYAEGWRPRSVVVLAEWADLLWSLAEESGDRFLFRQERTGGAQSHNLVTNFVFKLSSRETAPVAGRLR